ncbi:MAG: cysteine desulfurase NifS [Ruminococcus sp.]|nr:cysteine desulfurase NifS [Ruminococcus sp.]
MEKRFVYADNSATTKISKEVLDAMMPYLTEGYGNPSSIYKLGRDSKRAIETAREKCAAALGCTPSEIYFTGGGSESDNWALIGTAHKLAPTGKKHIITTAVEHHAILHTCAALEKEGFEVTYLPVDSEGKISLTDLENAIRPDTALVSIMYANNEIGVINPISEIGKICRKKGVLFHTDAVQAVGNVPINVTEQSIDMLSLSGHKIHAQKGVGILYIRRGINLPNLINGGGQERSKRAGTENVPAIVGLGVALENAVSDIPEKIEKVSKMRDRLIDGLLKIERTRLNGSRTDRLCGNVNISVEGVEGESLLLSLDLKGICASSGSACTSGSLDPSHVLLALGLPHEVAHGSLRLSISDETTDEDIDYILEVVPEVVDRLRSMSPLWERIKKAEK